MDFELESADAAVSRLPGRRAHFDGIVASSDLIALGAIRALRRAGVSVPNDVSVVGYDDMLLARLSTPALSTIRQDTFEAGRQLVSRILDPSPRPQRRAAADRPDRAGILWGVITIQDQVADPGGRLQDKACTRFCGCCSPYLWPPAPEQPEREA